MLRKVILLSLAAALVSCGKPSAVIIMDTGIGSECSEAAGLALLNDLSGGNGGDVGSGRLAAVVASNRAALSVPVIGALNAYYGNADVPSGEPKRSAPELELWHSDTKWTEYVAGSYPHRYERSSEAPDAVAVYRNALEHRPPGSVIVVATGFFTNLRDLLVSMPDDYSDRTGVELVAEKVRALYVVAGMAEGDREFNIEMDPAAARYVMDNWPGEIYITGRDSGLRIFTETLPDTTVTGNPLADIYRLSLRNGDPSVHSPFAPMAVLAAAGGTEKYFKTERGKLEIDDTGRDTWIPGDESNHYRLLPEDEDKLAATVEKKIREAMAR